MVVQCLILRFGSNYLKNFHKSWHNGLAHWGNVQKGQLVLLQVNVAPCLKLSLNDFWNLAEKFCLSKLNISAKILHIMQKASVSLFGLRSNLHMEITYYNICFMSCPYLQYFFKIFIKLVAHVQSTEITSRRHESAICISNSRSHMNLKHSIMLFVHVSFILWRMCTELGSNV